MAWIEVPKRVNSWIAADHQFRNLWSADPKIEGMKEEKFSVGESAVG